MEPVLRLQRDLWLNEYKKNKHFSNVTCWKALAKYLEWAVNHIKKTTKYSMGSRGAAHAD